MSRVAIIGNGNVGHHLSAAVSKTHGVSVFSRKTSDNVRAVRELKPDDFDFILLTVPDDLIRDVSNSIKKSDAIVLHTSGARPLSDLSAHPGRGVLYPLQTFSKEKHINFQAFPVFIEWAGEYEQQVTFFAKSFCGDVRTMNSSDRVKLHLAAVYACNFVNHLYHISESILSSADVQLKDLKHLAEETLEKAVEISPLKAQTGPAARNDAETMKNHLRMLENEDWKKIYELISNDIRKSQG